MILLPSNPSPVTEYRRFFCTPCAVLRIVLRTVRSIGAKAGYRVPPKGLFARFRLWHKRRYIGVSAGQIRLISYDRRTWKYSRPTRHLGYYRTDVSRETSSTLDAEALARVLANPMREEAAPSTPDRAIPDGSGCRASHSSGADGFSPCSSTDRAPRQCRWHCGRSHTS